MIFPIPNGIEGIIAICDGQAEVAFKGVHVLCPKGEGEAEAGCIVNIDQGVDGGDGIILGGPYINSWILRVKATGSSMPNPAMIRAWS